MRLESKKYLYDVLQAAKNLRLFRDGTEAALGDLVMIYATR